MENLSAETNLQQRDLISESGRTNYNTYSFTIPELILNILIAGILVWAIGYFFYDSVVATLLFVPGIPFFMKYRKKEYGKRRRDELRIQFRDAVNSVSANQKAGYSIENAFREAYNDMVLLYGSRSIICKELDYIRKGLSNNLLLENMLINLGERSGIDDVMQFGEVFAIAKRSGGNLTAMIEMTASVIEQKTDVEQEINVMISSRKMESNIMCLVPFFMIFYMSTTSKGFFDCLYHNVVGVVIMTVCLAIYIAAYLISQRLVDIRI